VVGKENNRLQGKSQRGFKERGILREEWGVRIHRVWEEVKRGPFLFKKDSLEATLGQTGSKDPPHSPRVLAKGRDFFRGEKKRW